MNKEIIICRCEEVSRREIEEAVADGAVTLNGVKRRTRAGMGLCQGRTCRKQVAGILAGATGQKVEDLLPPTSRPPVRTIPIGILLEGDDE
ncbi:(2Fe-2S)-binding protein [Clostridiales bacterium PH28_bin88]|nr:(2Fe-2S)-binding protein [Clostridiales bacterium PH28_bin88]